MDLGLKDKVVVVTGANAGIGLAVTRLFLLEGAKVVGCSRRIDALQAPLLDISSKITSDRLLPVSADLSTPEGPNLVIEKVIEAFGKIDILINNVGMAAVRNGFLSVGDQDWQKVMDTNFMSMVRTTRAALPHMIKQKSGAVVSISSEVARMIETGMPDYSVSKTAVTSLSKALSNEFGPMGIRFNVVSPGVTETPLWMEPGGFADSMASVFQMDKESAIDHFIRNVRRLPIARMGKPEEVASVIAFLASDQASFVTGSEYAVNGGSLKEI